MELNINGPSSPKTGNIEGQGHVKKATALPISTKINQVGLKKMSKPSLVTQSPKNKGTGVEEPNSD